MKFLADNRHEWAMPEGEFVKWRQENNVSAMCAPTILYWKRMRRNETVKCLPIGVQQSFVTEGIRRQWGVIYREIGTGVTHCISVQEG